MTLRATAQTDIPASDVSGTWDQEHSPYLVSGKITVPDDSTLIIEPGVEIVFTGHYMLNVQGRLLAVGTAEEPIKFRAQDIHTGWHGIRFHNTKTSNDSTKIVYCDLRHGRALGAFPDDCGGAILSTGYGKFLVSNCVIDSNYANYVGGGIVLGYSASPVIRNNIISNNYAPWGGGIGIVNKCHPLMENNIIIHNRCRELGGGVQVNQSSRPVLINNTITGNHAGCGGGIDCRDGSSPTIINTIVAGNTANSGDQVYLYVANCDPNFYHCVLEGGMEAFEGPGAGDNYSGSFSNNVDCEPLFVSKTEDDYHLSASSPCIGAGADSILAGDTWIYAPERDFENNARPSPAGSPPDIGAFENGLEGPVTTVCESAVIPHTCSLMPNFPNPFNPETTIHYVIAKESFVRLTVTNVLGETVRTIVHDFQKPAEYKIRFNGSNLPGGIYMVTLSTQQNENIETVNRKILLIK